MSEKPPPYTVLGLMSGTSLDGLDLALCEFKETGDAYAFNMIRTRTVAYDAAWRKHLAEAAACSAEDFFILHARYGRYLGEQALAFIKEAGVRPAAIASHGHTIFHQPALGFSTQLGCGATLAAHTGITTVCDFRSLDVALGGQGAPLVPIGDKLLFGRYSACLNLGGIANLSFADADGKRLAYDICEANMLLNYLAQKAGKDFDEDGQMARSGTVNQTLLHELNGQDYYLQKGAKSLGREWFEKHVLPILNKRTLNENALLATATEHVSDQIAVVLNELELENVLVTGGGAFNAFLMDKLRSKTETELILPEPQLVNFKEALIFAFLGYLRLNGKINTLGSVTGARADSVGGAVYSFSSSIGSQ